MIFTALINEKMTDRTLTNTVGRLLIRLLLLSMGMMDNVTHGKKLCFHKRRIERLLFCRCPLLHRYYIGFISFCNSS